MIIALMTLYQPDEDVLGHIVAIADQVDMLYLCDNSKRSSVEKYSGIPKTRYLFFNENLGLSMAFNKVLKSNPFAPDDYIIFFDQDSEIPSGHIARLIAEYETLEQQGVPLGCIAPVYFDRYMQKKCLPSRKTTINDLSYKVPSVITSSMLCRYKTLQDIGFWNEHVFLDWADIELCWRLGSQDKVCVITERTVLDHAVREGCKKVAFFTVVMQQSVRDYYQIRDSLYLLGRPYVSPRQKIGLVVFHLVMEPLWRILFMGDRLQRLQMVLRGWRDFFLGRHGSFDSSL